MTTLPDKPEKSSCSFSFLVLLVNIVYPLTQGSAIDWHCGVRYQLSYGSGIIAGSGRSGEIPRNSAKSSPESCTFRARRLLSVSGGHHILTEMEPWANGTFDKKCILRLRLGFWPALCFLLSEIYEALKSTETICMFADQCDPFVSRTRKLYLWNIVLGVSVWEEYLSILCVTCERLQVASSTVLSNWACNLSDSVS